ncbi:MAG TPA: alpha/beta hydrolase, partial [Acidimicrobiales bacterium]|nr:alpha/beta hydrolase [Acidimicrobiales bacterium]
MALDPQSQMFIEAMRSAGMLPLRDLGVDGCRRMTEQQASLAKGSTAGSVEDGITGDPAKVPIRLYRPDGVHGPLPVVVYFHGGGWVMGGIGSHDDSCRHLSDLSGCLVVSVDYRLAPEHPFPAAIDDAWAAARWVMDHADDLGGDRQLVAVAGDSAGGNLAGAVARLARDDGRELAFQLLIYPVVDRRLDRPSMVQANTDHMIERDDMDWFWRMYDPDGVAAADPRAALTAEVDLSGLPPALVITAEHDPLRDEGEEYADRLQNAGVPATRHRYPGVFHGFYAMRGFLDAATAAADEAAAALRAAFAVAGEDRGSGVGGMLGAEPPSTSSTRTHEKE